jgi:hydroxypyruvate reductase
MAGPGGLRRARQPLLQSLAAVTAKGLSSWPQILQREAGAYGLTMQWRGQLAENPVIAAVRVAHAIEMGPPGMQAWYADWPSVLESAPLEFAATVAGLLAGSEPLLVLASAVDGIGGDAGALVDGESCARMTAAGFDPETEVRLGNCAELLGSAGDLVSMPPRTDVSVIPTQILILGLKWHAPADN